MEIGESSRADALDLQLFAPANPLTAGIEGLWPVLDALEQAAPWLRPERAHADTETIEYSPLAVERLLAGQQRSMLSLTLDRVTSPPVTYAFSFFRGNAPLGLWLWAAAPMAYLASRESRDERSRQLLALAEALMLACEPAYGFAHSRVDGLLGADPHWRDPFAPEQLNEVYWLNLFGPTMVDRLGRDRVLSAPGSLLEVFPYGGVLLLTHPYPAEYASEGARVAQASAYAHLTGADQLQPILDRLRQRGEVPPVEIQELLALMLGDLPSLERVRQAARWQAYRPPPVTEWRPAEEMLLPDVPDPAAAVRDYRSLHAENLIILLHTKVPHLFPPTPESLPFIDHSFWRTDPAGQLDPSYLQNTLIPAAGAFLGCLLVDYLEGSWVPRLRLDETQVVVGDRAWLPFLRARHCLQSKQSILDYSLTQFYREAERHVRGPCGTPGAGVDSP
jgi:hypothetical protein